MVPIAKMTAKATGSGAVRAALVAALTLWVGVAVGCDDPAPSFAPVAEPSEALRPPAQRGEIPEQARVVDYRIDARLDERAHEIHGVMRMVWRNRTQRTVDRLPFHLYMNGFRAEDTAWMAEARGQHRGKRFVRDRWGFVSVARVEELARNPAQPEVAIERAPAGPGRALRFTEDAEPSTMSVALDTPLGPGDSIVLELAFVTRLPQVFARTGYYGDFHMAGQWFPKIGVLEERGGWQAHTFGLFSEFYADFGDYEVLLDVPAHYIVGASGVRVGEDPLDGGRKRLHYRAQMVHDFAWAADPDFIEHWGEYEGIRIRQLIQPKHVDDAAAHLEAQIHALASMEARFGPYPWSTITIVHPPAGAGGAGGMEYPTLYTTGNIAATRGLPPWLVRERISGVFTTVHEFGHQYFQGLFASNEHAQPWLDEGMNTTANMLVYQDAYGEDPWIAEILGHPLTIKDLSSLSLLFTADRDPVDQPADRFDPLVESYGAVTYQKTAAVMLTLRELCGREPWDRAMTRYAERARFDHPDGALLESILVETIGGADGRLALVGEGGPGTVWLDVQDYLDQGLREAPVAEFRLLAVGNRRRLGRSGWHLDAASGREDGDAPTSAEPNPILREGQRGLAALLGHAPPEGPEGWTLHPSPASWGRSAAGLPVDEVEGFVIVQRRSSFRVPVEVLVEFEDGARQTLLWDGQAPRHRFNFPGRRVRRAVVDPRMILLIEPRKLDNAGWARSSPSAADRDNDLGGWIGDIDEAAVLSILGGLGI